MATNCYSADLPLAVCVDGIINATTTANLSVEATNGTALVGNGNIGMQSNWNGSAVTFTNWHDNPNWGGCTVNSTSLTVTLVSDDMVQVDVNISVTCDPSDAGGDIYFECNGAGTHTFTDSKTVPLVIGDPCPT